MKESIVPPVLAAAINVFMEEEYAIRWLSTPLQALGQKRPVDADIKAVIELPNRLEHGYGA
nr:antitoxin Xre/MbcA/ParS toxin-binding domain-containing protein [Pseudomonas flavescens]